LTVVVSLCVFRAPSYIKKINEIRYISLRAHPDDVELVFGNDTKRSGL
jgi:hypothetical protein